MVYVCHWISTMNTICIDLYRCLLYYVGRCMTMAAWKVPWSSPWSTFHGRAMKISPLDIFTKGAQVPAVVFLRHAVSDGTVGETCLDVQQRFVSCIQFYNMIQSVCNCVMQKGVSCACFSVNWQAYETPWLNGQGVLAWGWSSKVWQMHGLISHE